MKKGGVSVEQSEQYKMWSFPDMTRCDLGKEEEIAT